MPRGYPKNGVRKPATRTPEQYRIWCENISKANKGCIPWNKGTKGLTKCPWTYENSPLVRYNKARKGKTNVESFGEETARRITEKRKSKPSSLKGKSLEEIFGPEKAVERLKHCRQASKRAAELTKGIPRPVEIRAKVSDGNREAWKRLEAEGKKEEIYKKIAEKLRGTKHPPCSEERRENSRKAILKSILEKGYCPQNNYRRRKEIIETNKGGQVYCQSSWEVVFAKYLDENQNVVSFAKDKIRIPYLYNSKKKIYITDFFIHYLSGEKELIEIKPLGLINDGENPFKFEAARNWCLSQEIKFKVVTEEGIKEINSGILPSWTPKTK